jgi:hypothetical protein
MPLASFKFTILTKSKDITPFLKLTKKEKKEKTRFIFLLFQIQTLVPQQ